MKPASYQVISSSLNGVQPEFGLSCLSGASKVRFPERAGHESAEAAVFNKTVVDHKQMQYTCFYCNTVFLREVHLLEHMKQHTKHYPYVCPYCAQGYMKRLCLVKHIERFHSKDIIQGSAKSGRIKITQDSVRGVVRSAPTGDLTTFSPFVHVTASTQGKPTVRVEKDQQVAKRLEANSSNTTNGNTENVTSLNGHTQHNRALTVSLPDEVNIPAGCLVELVEVKTVNGTKELKLRVVSQQENKSVVKEKRTTIGQNTALAKPLSSTLKQPIKVTPMTMGVSTINRKRYEINTANVEQPAVIPVSTSNSFRNPVGVNKRGPKRQPQEIINLESNTPSKVRKILINPPREDAIKVTSPINLKAPPPTVNIPRIISNRPVVCQKVVGESKTEIPENIKITPPQRKSDAAHLAMTFEPGGSHLSSKAITNSVREALALSLNSRPAVPLRTPTGPTAPVRPPAAPLNKDNDVKKIFSIPKSLNKTVLVKTPVDLNYTPPQSTQAQPNNVPAQSFPVISSVFSLSQQPENLQGTIKPVLMALRGVVLDKMIKCGSTPQDVETNGTEETLEGPVLGDDTWAEKEKGASAHETLMTKQTNDSIKQEQDKDFQLTPVPNVVHVKEEKYNPPPTPIKDDSTDFNIPNAKHSTEAQPVSTKPSPEGASEVSTQTSHQTLKSEHDLSKFVTVSLERIRVGHLEKQESGLKDGLAKDKSHAHGSSQGGCTIMPLKRNQAVKTPGPNQPVVVLNHPRPRMFGQKTMAASSSKPGTHRELPECQILKMRLSKVVGQKYEVMGYTVKVSQ